MKRFLSTASVLLFLFLVFTGTGKVSACSCIPSAPCSSFGNSDVVFVGKVVGSKRQVTRDDYSGESDRPKKVTYDVGEIYFVVEEAFNGAIKGARVTIHSIESESACGYMFKRGEKYLVFARKEESKAPSNISSLTYGRGGQKLKPLPQRLWTGLCSGTREIEDAEEALKYLRNLPQPGSGGMIVGRIDESIKDYSEENLKGKPMSDAKIRVQEIGGEKRSFYGTSNKNGYFEIKIPVGTYKVAPELAADLSFESHYRSGEDDLVKIEDRRCQIRIFWVSNDSEVSGKVIDPDGKLNGDVVLDLIPADKERTDKNFHYDFIIVDDDGSFELKGIAPGRYFLSLNYRDRPEDDSPYPTFFYPNTGSRKEAKLIEIGMGTKFKDMVFQLPPKLVKRGISGTVVWKNGKPVAGAEIQLKDVEFNRDALFKGPVTNAQGEFVLEWFEGRQYQVTVIVWKRNPDGSGVGIADGESEKFILDSETKPFRIVLMAIDPNEKSIFTTTVRAN